MNIAFRLLIHDENNVTKRLKLCTARLIRQDKKDKEQTKNKYKIPIKQQ